MANVTALGTKVIGVTRSFLIFFLGGFDGSMPLNTAEYYDPKLGKWIEVPRMNQCRFGVGCAVLNGMVYAVGGSDGTNLRTVERYDPEANTWTVVAPMNTARRVIIRSFFTVIGLSKEERQIREERKRRGTFSDRGAKPPVIARLRF